MTNILLLVGYIFKNKYYSFIKINLIFKILLIYKMSVAPTNYIITTNSGTQDFAKWATKTLIYREVEGF